MSDPSTFDSLLNDLTECLAGASSEHSEFELISDYYAVEIPADSVPSGRVRRAFAAVNEDCLNEFTVGLVADIMAVVASNRDPHVFTDGTPPASAIGGVAELHVAFLAARQALSHSPTLSLMSAYARLLRLLVTASGYAPSAGGTNAAVTAATPSAVASLCALADTVAHCTSAQVCALLSLASIAREFATAPNTAPPDGGVPGPLLKSLLHPLSATARAPVLSAAVSALHGLVCTPRPARLWTGVVRSVVEAGTIGILTPATLGAARRLRSERAALGAIHVQELVTVRRACEVLAVLAASAGVEDLEAATSALREAAGVVLGCLRGGDGAGGGGGELVSMFGDAFGDIALQVDDEWDSSAGKGAGVGSYIVGLCGKDGGSGGRVEVTKARVASFRRSLSVAEGEGGGGDRRSSALAPSRKSMDGPSSRRPSAGPDGGVEASKPSGTDSWDGRVEVPTDLAAATVLRSVTACANALASVWGALSTIAPDAVTSSNAPAADCVAAVMLALREGALWESDAEVVSEAMLSLVQLLSNIASSLTPSNTPPATLSTVAAGVAGGLDLLQRLAVGTRGLCGASRMVPLASAVASALHRLLLLPDGRASLCVAYMQMGGRGGVVELPAHSSSSQSATTVLREGIAALVSSAVDVVDYVDVVASTLYTGTAGSAGTEDDVVGGVGRAVCGWLDVLLTSVGANPAAEVAIETIMRSDKARARIIGGIRTMAGPFCESEALSCLLILLQLIARDSIVRPAAIARLVEEGLVEALMARCLATPTSPAVVVAALHAVGYVGTTLVGRKALLAADADAVGTALVRRWPTKHSPQHAALAWAFAPLLVAAASESVFAHRTVELLTDQLAAAECVRDAAAQRQAAAAARQRAAATARALAASRRSVSRPAVGGDGRVASALQSLRSLGAVGVDLHAKRTAGERSRSASQVQIADKEKRSVADGGEDGEEKASVEQDGWGVVAEADGEIRKEDEDEAGVEAVATGDEAGARSRRSSAAHVVHKEAGDTVEEPSPLPVLSPAPSGTTVSPPSSVRPPVAEVAFASLEMRVRTELASLEEAGGGDSAAAEAKSRNLIGFVRKGGLYDVLTATRAQSFGVLTWSQCELVWAAVAMFDRKESEFVMIDRFDAIVVEEEAARTSLSASAAASLQTAKNSESQRVLRNLKSPEESVAATVTAALQETVAKESLFRVEVEMAQKDGWWAIQEASQHRLAVLREGVEAAAARERLRALELEIANAAAEEESLKRRCATAEAEAAALIEEYESAKGRATSTEAEAKAAATEILQRAHEKAAEIEAAAAAAAAAKAAAVEAAAASKAAASEAAAQARQAAAVQEWEAKTSLRDKDFADTVAAQEANAHRILADKREEHEAAWRARYEELVRREEAAKASIEEAQYDAAEALRNRDRVSLVAEETIARVGVLAVEAATSAALVARLTAPIEILRARSVAEAEVDQLTDAVTGYTQRVEIITWVQQLVMEEAEVRAEIAGESAKTRMAVVCACMSGLEILKGQAAADAAREKVYKQHFRDLVACEGLFRRTLHGEEVRGRVILQQAAASVFQMIEASRVECRRQLMIVNTGALVRRESVNRLTLYSAEGRERESLWDCYEVATESLALRATLRDDAEASAKQVITEAAEDASARRAAAAAAVAVIIGPAMESHEGLHRAALIDAELAHRAALYDFESTHLASSVDAMLTAGLLQIQHEELEDRGDLEEFVEDSMMPLYEEFWDGLVRLRRLERSEKGRVARATVEGEELGSRGRLADDERVVWSALLQAFAAGARSLTRSRSQEVAVANEAALIAAQQMFGMAISQLVVAESESRCSIFQDQLAEALDLTRQFIALRDVSRAAFASVNEAAHAALLAARGRADAAESQLSLVAPDGVEGLTALLQTTSSALKESEAARKALDDELKVAKAAAKAAVRELVAERQAQKRGGGGGAGGGGVHFSPPAKGAGGAVGNGVQNYPSTTAPSSVHPTRTPNVSDYERYLSTTGDPSDRFVPEFYGEHAAHPLASQLRYVDAAQHPHMLGSSAAVQRASGPLPLSADRRAAFTAARTAGVSVTHVGGELGGRKASFVDQKRAIVLEQRSTTPRM